MREPRDELTDVQRTYRCILDGLKQIIDYQTRHDQVPGMNRPMVIAWVEQRLGKTVALNAHARLSELANMGAIKRQGYRKNPQTGANCSNYVLGTGVVTEYVPRNTRYKDLLVEAVNLLKPHPEASDLVQRATQLLES